jgi:putative addiction module component (TIGR02574 family)
MTTLKIRKKVIDIVEHADDRILKVVYAMLTEYEKNEPSNSHLTKEQQEEIDKRWENHLSGRSKSYSIEQVGKFVKAGLKK